ncbi:MAG: kynureninase [Thermaurantimonas sp.]
MQWKTYDYHKADQADVLRKFREAFHMPKHTDGTDKIYLTGNSLGLQPKAVRALILEELEDWAALGVDGHTHARRPWMPYHELLTRHLSYLTGARPSEVVAMNTLTANLHLLMASFYRPTKWRHKIICESKAFPSDYYAIDSQARFHGYTNAILEIPADAQGIISESALLNFIDQNADDTALLLMGGVNYYTGQVFDIEKITIFSRERGITVGWDLAHAIGNIPLALHEWGVDFAAWCSYKYLNGGPGAVAGIFVHERHHTKALPRFEGWWGHNKSTRFHMPHDFEPMPSAEAWQLSNPPILSMTPLLASLPLFEEAGWKSLREKSNMFTSFLVNGLREINDAYGAGLTVVTPCNTGTIGCQLSVVFRGWGRKVFDFITERGVVADWREPEVIRIAPVPLYNSFADIYKTLEIIEQAILTLKK